MAKARRQSEARERVYSYAAVELKLAQCFSRQEPDRLIYRSEP